MNEAQGRVRLARGEFGSVVPVRPGATTPEWCLRGHRLEVAGRNGTYNHVYALHQTSCNVCCELEFDSDMERWRASWCVVDPSRQYDASAAPTDGLVLVRVPPARRAAPGRIELRLAGKTVGDIDVVLCPIDGETRRAGTTRVDELYRRHGYGRVLVAAALTLGRDYDWSTTAVNKSIEVRTFFWARIGPPGPTVPAYCSHMQESSGIASDA
jgi:GNAT superfamily N-acetyltransferase